MAKYANGKFAVKNPEKYMGKRTPTYRSSWEFAFMNFCDNNPAVLNWTSESVKIPYFNPVSGKNTIYVPDFLIIYVDRSDAKHAEVIEIKPRKEISMENARSARDQAAAVLNAAKWAAARAWCAQQGLKFRIVTEEDIFAGVKKTR